MYHIGALSTSRKSAVSRLDDDEKANLKLGFRGGDINVVNEYGLYNLVIASRKPEAKTFKRWITHEVIPAIRKHGGYLTNEKIEEVLSDPDTIIKLATSLKEERAKRQEAEKQLKAAEMALHNAGYNNESIERMCDELRKS